MRCSEDNFCISEQRSNDRCTDIVVALPPQQPPPPPQQSDPPSQACEQGSAALRIRAEPPQVACTGEEARFVVRVLEGGAEPYAWRLRSAVPGLILTQDGSDEAILSGSFQLEEGTAEQTVSVQVEVESEGNCAFTEIFVEVHQTPRIVTELPNACVAQEYNVELRGEGGDAESYEWQVRGAGLSIVEEAGASRLVGAAPSEPTSLDVDLILRDRYCPTPDAAPQPLSTSINVRGSGECPQIGPSALRPPCADIAYEQALVPSGGSGEGYTWSVVEETLPEGLEFDAEAGVLSGTALSSPAQASEASSAQGEAVPRRLEVLLTDSLGQTASKRFDVSLRNSCWWAYLSEEEAGTSLHFADVFQQNDKALPATLSEGESVADFEFSPSGEWLAFRAGPADGMRLFLYPTASPLAEEATPIAFDCPEALCSVLDYAWAHDSSQLAVILGGASELQDYATGVDVETLEVWPTLATLDYASLLAPPLDYQGGLRWAGDSYGFVGPDAFLPPGLGQVTYIGFPGSLVQPSAALTSGTGLVLQGEPNAFFVSSDAGTTYAFLPPPVREPNGPLVLDPRGYGFAWPSPGGEHVAKTSAAGELEVYRVGGGPEPVAVSEPGTCPTVIAWSERLGSRERIACSGSASASGNPPDAALQPIFDGARIFTFDAQADQLSNAEGQRLLGSVAGGDQWLPGGAEVLALANTRRIFSPGGERLLIGDPERGAIALFTLPDNVSAFAPPEEMGVYNVVSMGFANNGSRLFTYGIEGLLRDPLTEQATALLSEDAEGQRIPLRDSFPTCVEALWRRPSEWCGSPASAEGFLSAADGLSVAFEAQDEVLWLADNSRVLNRELDPAQRISVLPACSGECRRARYDFQPN